MAVKQHNTTRWLVCAGAFLLVLTLAAATPRATWADGGARGPDAPGRLADLGNPTLGDPDQPGGNAPAYPPPDDDLSKAIQERTHAVVTPHVGQRITHEPWVWLTALIRYVLSYQGM